MRISKGVDIYFLQEVMKESGCDGLSVLTSALGDSSEGWSCRQRKVSRAMACSY